MLTRIWQCVRDPAPFLVLALYAALCLPSRPLRDAALEGAMLLLALAAGFGSGWVYRRDAEARAASRAVARELAEWEGRKRAMLTPRSRSGGA